MNFIRVKKCPARDTAIGCRPDNTVVIVVTNARAIPADNSMARVAYLSTRGQDADYAAVRVLQAD